MYVYVAEFEGRPGLVKIGVAVNVKTRMAGLSKAHGAVTRVRKFNLGERRYAVEAEFHKKYAEYREQLSESCDGYTEFFSDCVRDEAEILLKQVANESKLKVCTVKPIRASSTAVAATVTKKTRMDSEKELSVQRLLVSDLAYKRYCEHEKKVSKFLERLFRHSQWGSFSCLHYTELYYLATSVSLGVNIDAVIDTFIERARISHGKRLTKYRANVVIHAINGTLSNRRGDFWRSVFTDESQEAYYLTLLEKGVVDEAALEALVADDDGMIKVSDGRRSCIKHFKDNLRNISALRESQILRL